MCCTVAVKQRLQYQPNYLILVDVRDRPKQLTTYVAEDSLEVLHRTVVRQFSLLYLCVFLSLNCFNFNVHFNTSQLYLFILLFIDSLMPDCSGSWYRLDSK